MPRVSTHELPAPELSARDAYRVMTDLVAPRPIAWVSTVDAAGRRNLAPFSYYQAVCSSPPMLVNVNGLLVPPKNPELLADALLTLVLDEKLRQRIGRDAQRIVAERFDVARQAEQVSQLLDVAGA